MKIKDIYWRAFNFLARRIAASCFFFGGLAVVASNISCLLPGGTISVDGHLSTDLFIRSAAVALPLFMALVGVLLFCSKPYYPIQGQQTSQDDT